MADKDKKIDPFDVEALEKSLNDSATRVSTIWVSFLIFSLYLLTAATTVTHRQLFLAEPIKLPVLNIDLPLWGFFFLAPILFVILYVYVLIQVVLLGRTAAMYNDALDRTIRVSTDNARVRQRLANTLFAQIFAGSPRERAGAFGWLLKSVAWITLALAPILILLVFQFKFLPYHSHFVTWTHRLLVLVGFALAFQLWPLVLNPARDFQRPAFAWFGLRLRAAPLAVAILFGVVSLWLATFPGEPHVNFLTGRPIDNVECERWAQQKFGFADLRFDRLTLARADVIDHEKLAKIEQTTSKTGEQPHEGERTRVLRDRDFDCGDFSDYADLRRIDLSGSRLRNANFGNAKLHGASFINAQLRGASFGSAQLQAADFTEAQLQGASFFQSKLQGAKLLEAQLQGADLLEADLQGAVLVEARLPAAALTSAQLQGANLGGAELQGADLRRAWLQGASLRGAQLQGADLTEAQLQGASLAGAQLQGASLVDAGLDGAVLTDVQIWRTRVSDCDKALVSRVRADAAIFEHEIGQKTPATVEEIEKSITSWVAKVPSEYKKEASERMRRVLIPPAGDDGTSLAEVWRRCESEFQKQENFDDAQVAILHAVVCGASEDSAAARARGVARNWISPWEERRAFIAKLARSLLGEGSEGTCARAEDYDEATKKALRAAAGSSPVAPQK